MNDFSGALHRSSLKGMIYIPNRVFPSQGDEVMNGPAKGEKFDLEKELPDDVHVRKLSVPGGWIYVTFITREGEEGPYTSEISTVYIPGRR